MSTFTAVIIEDELHGRESLSELIKAYVPGMDIVGYGADVESGVSIIIEKQPSVVFLDIRLGNRSGFDIIRQVPIRNFSLVITSAYEEYALDAFKAEAIDYLLKPVAKDDLLNTMKRIRERDINSRSLETQWPSISRAFEQPARNKIAVPASNGLIFLSIEDILRCEADGVYTKIVLRTQQPILTTRNLGEYEKVLTPAMGFLRIHHSVIINMKEVVRYIRGDGGQVTMSDGVTLDVSRRKKSEFLEWIDKI